MLSQFSRSSFRLLLLIWSLCFLSSEKTLAQSADKEAQASGVPQATVEQPSFDNSLSNKLKGNFLKRLIEFYKQDWKGHAQGGSEPPRRIPPAPLDSPPFPSADWNYGGAPVIGAPDTNVYPLMQALNGDQSKIKVYGWVEPSLNVSTSKHTLFPLGYNIFANRVELDQA